MVLESGVEIFGLGCIGGVLAELLHWWGLRRSPQLPQYLKSAFYWAITLAMIVAGGFIAWLYFGNRADPVLVVHVGLSAPLILQKLATTIPETDGAKSIVATPAPTIRRFFTW